MSRSRSLAAFRIIAVACFIAIIGWLSVVIGIAAINLTVRSWCAAASACEQVFWPRLIIAAVGGILGFVISGYALMSEWHGRRILPFAAAAALVTVGTGLWFWPIVTG